MEKAQSCYAHVLPGSLVGHNSMARKQQQSGSVLTLLAAHMHHIQLLSPNLGPSRAHGTQRRAGHCSLTYAV
jgi:hypothetical protein